MSVSAIPRQLRTFVFQRDKEFCQYCRLSQIGHAATFHINHVMPRSKGGVTDVSNLVLQRPYCSSHKSVIVETPDPETGEMINIFHPIRQSWHSHSAVDVTGRCHGLSATGRGTIVSVHVNDGLPIVARQLRI